MRIKALVVGLFLAATTGSACAAGPYLGVSGGVSIFHDADMKVSGSSVTATTNYNSGYGFGANAGYNFDPVRLEFEFGYRKADVDHLSGPGGSLSVDDTNVKVMSYLVNGYYDIKTGTIFTPYVGAGLGVLDGELQVQGTKYDDTVFGYQIAVGTTIAVDQHIALDFSYKFQGAGSDFSKDGVSLSYLNSSFSGGFRYSF
ncbi:porin family protein [Oryzomonas sagensis]|uniref:Porin family protein n=1 Tax=Oryzomonas sagensis TaxID=2603857 RepID=A0ABQ6TNM3_9BACT|nr:outer membrane beta-barrel protein [Oryzomonas sagensis]KAB0670257.1 porin family protein [Oryzomonas sagensis]